DVRDGGCDDGVPFGVGERLRTWMAGIIGVGRDAEGGNAGGWACFRVCATLRRTWHGKSLRGSSNSRVFEAANFGDWPKSVIVVADVLARGVKDFAGPSVDVLVKPTSFEGWVSLLG